MLPVPGRTLTVIAPNRLTPNSAMRARAFFEVRFGDAWTLGLVEDVFLERDAFVIHVSGVLRTREEQHCHLDVRAVLHVPPMLDDVIHSDTDGLLTTRTCIETAHGMPKLAGNQTASHDRTPPRSPRQMQSTDEAMVAERVTPTLNATADCPPVRCGGVCDVKRGCPSVVRCGCAGSAGMRLYVQGSSGVVAPVDREHIR